MTVYFLLPSVSSLLLPEHEWQLLLTLLYPMSDGDVLRSRQSLSSVLCDVNKAWLNKSLLQVRTVQGEEMRPI